MATPDNETIEFEFPDPDKKEVPAKQEELQIDVVDDTPEADKGRKPMTDPPLDPTDEELKSYSESAQKRIKHMTKGYHDERRAKEAAARERDEATRVARAALEEVKRLKGSNDETQNALIETSKTAAAAEVAAARKKFKEACELFDAEAMAEAQAELNAAQIKQDRVNNFTKTPLQEEKSVVQPDTSAQQRQPAVSVDPQALAWKQQNEWFGTDTEMTSYVLGLHQKLVMEEGVNPQSNDYYKRLNAGVRKRFPENFESDTSTTDEPAKKPSVVAPATRSTAPKKVVLTKTQVSLAKKFGLTLEQYARQVAIEEKRNQNG